MTVTSAHEMSFSGHEYHDYSMKLRYCKLESIPGAASEHTQVLQRRLLKEGKYQHSGKRMAQARGPRTDQELSRGGWKTKKTRQFATVCWVFAGCC